MVVFISCSHVFVRDGWSIVLCVHVCVRAVDSGGTAMDQSVRVLYPPTHLRIVALHCRIACACPHARCWRYLVEVVVSCSLLAF